MPPCAPPHLSSGLGPHARPEPSRVAPSSARRRLQPAGPRTEAWDRQMGDPHAAMCAQVALSIAHVGQLCRAAHATRASPAAHHLAHSWHAIASELAHLLLARPAGCHRPLQVSHRCRPPCMPSGCTAGVPDHDTPRLRHSVQSPARKACPRVEPAARRCSTERVVGWVGGVAAAAARAASSCGRSPSSAWSSSEAGCTTDATTPRSASKASRALCAHVGTSRRRP